MSPLRILCFGDGLTLSYTDELVRTLIKSGIDAVVEVDAEPEASTHGFPVCMRRASESSL